MWLVCEERHENCCTTSFEASRRFLSRMASWYVFPPVGATCIPGRISLEKEGGRVRCYVPGVAWEFELPPKKLGSQN